MDIYDIIYVNLGVLVSIIMLPNIKESLILNNCVYGVVVTSLSCYYRAAYVKRPGLPDPRIVFSTISIKSFVSVDQCDFVVTAILFNHTYPLTNQNTIESTVAKQSIKSISI